MEKIKKIWLWVSGAIVSFIGLLWLSYAEGNIAFLAAGVFAIGITYFWPTMLGYVSEYIPESGALGFAIMGGAGMLSVSIILPSMGNIFDTELLAAIPTEFSLDALKESLEGTPEFKILTNAKMLAGSNTLRKLTGLPAMLIVAFTGLVIYTSRKGKKNN